ncbi:MAG: BrnT family toxin [Rhodocyclaceae bacterium]|nr:BrnT family toxin [Rhodocyclaceae bacterium]
MDERYERNGTLFVWNREKAAANLRKHGVSFVEAATVFDDPLLRVIDASRHGEARDAAIGFDTAARLLYVVHITDDGESIRLISARRATREEERHYAE